MSAVTLLSKLRWPYRRDSYFSTLALVLLVVPLGLTIYTRENFETVKYSLLLIGCGALLLVAVVKYIRQEAVPKLLFNKYFLSLLFLFLLWSAVATIFSPDKINSVFGFYYRFTNSLLFYGLWVIFVLGLLLVESRQRLMVLIKFLVFDSVIIALLGLLQSQGFAYYEGLNTSGFLRAPSLLGNPIFSSMFIAGLLPFVFYFWSTAKVFTAKLYYGLASFVILAAIIVLASRGTWLAAGAALVVMLFFAMFYGKSKKVLWASLLAVLVVGVVMVGFLKVYKIQSNRLTFSFSEENISTRLLAWEMARQAIISHPVVGVGLGNFQQFFEHNRIEYLSSASQVFDDAHNLFLQIAATGGLPLLVFFVGAIGVALFFGAQAYKNTQDNLFLAAICSVVVFAVAGSFTPVAIPCFLSLAVVLALLVSQVSVPKQLPAWKWLKVPLVVLGIVFIYGGAALLISEHLFYRSTFAYTAGDVVRAKNLSDWAIKLNPTNQLYYLYNTGSRILADPSDPKIQTNMGKIISMHRQAANSYSMVGTLNFVWFLKTGKAEHINSAIGYLKQSLSIDPENATRYFRLGYYYMYAGQLDPAREASKTGLSLDKTILPGWLQLARIYQIQNKRQQTIFALEQAFKLRPDLPELALLLKTAKTAKNIQTVPIFSAPEQGSLE